MDKILTTAVKASIVVIVITHDNESTDNIYKTMIVKIFFSIKLCTHQTNTHLNPNKLKKENIQIDKNQDYTKSNP